MQFERNIIQYPNHLNIADKQFNIPKTIDVLLGSKIFYKTIGTGKLRLGENMPAWHETNLGWILTGEIITNVILHEQMVCHISTISNET